ncbi:MAG TPA: undecaprenyldiphospho-muramoylpentapeptide beta-N-acetylglucosaminyltransferase [Acidimicrobiales bacterium]|nr:undecaprenyldiphospho-muramoylpentapeptide beta-N-acetylglucosaminyltransferase [Acidimicrobiales bacterium]
MAPAYAVIAGGGTGGHVVPAIAIGRALVARGHEPETIHFVGSNRGIERRLVPEAGFPLTVLPGRGIARRLTPGNVLANAGAVLGLASAFVQAVLLLRRLRPRVVVSVGGYAAAPCALAAVLWRVPLVLHEQNASAGAVHRLVGRFAAVTCASYPGTGLPREVVTGNPVRDEILAVRRTPEARAQARRRLGLPDGRLVVAAFGGSLGARRINEAVAGLVGKWADRAGLAVRHAVGARDWPTFSAGLPVLPPAGLSYMAVEFEDRMPDLLAAADVAVCRAGGSTVAELAVVGVPTVFVPLPMAPGDHQTKNAAGLVAAGAAVLVPDGDLTAERLARELDALLADPDHLATMGKAAQSVARPDAADLVADQVEQHARG